MKKPVVELSDCILCEICTEAYPSVFIMNDAGYVAVADLPEYPEKEINEVIKNCPANCIYWE